MSPDSVREAVANAFGSENRKRLLDAYFTEAPPVSADNAWQHVYRLLLWIDQTIGLAHCYESDKCQPGRPWYGRSLRFHAWVASSLGTTPDRLGSQIDWLFRKASRDLARGISKGQEERAVRQRARYAGQDMPEPGQDPELEEIILEELEPWLRERPPQKAMKDVTERIHQHTRLENKRKNLVGEGFEDVLTELVERLPETAIKQITSRAALHEIPGFYEPPGGEKLRKVDLAVVRGDESQRALVTVKWSIRADREEQFVSDYRIYTRLERAGQPFDYVLVTNEFDPARLVAAAERQWEGHPLFSDVVHVSTDALRATYGEKLHRSFGKVVEHIDDGRIRSLASWLSELQQ